MGFNQKIENQAINELKQALNRVCDSEKMLCVKLLIKYYYTRMGRLKIQVLNYEQEFQMMIEINKIDSMTSFELQEAANVWFERLVILDQFHT